MSFFRLSAGLLVGFLLFPSFICTAQRLLRGVVTYRMIDDSQPLSGVSVKVGTGSPKETDAFGRFELKLPDGEVKGEWVLSIVKNGFEVVNKNEMISPNPDKLIRVVMCKTGERDKWAARFYNLAVDSIYIKYDRAKKDVRDLKISQSALKAKNDSLERELNQNLNYAKQFSVDLADKNLAEASPLYKRALYYFTRNQMDSARQVFRLANLEQHEKQIALDRLFYAQLLVLDNDFSAAETNFKRAIELFEDFETVRGYAEFLKEQGNSQQVLPLYRKLISLATNKPDSAWTASRLGSLLQDLHQFQEAEKWNSFAFQYWAAKLKKEVSASNIREYFNSAQYLEASLKNNKNFNQVQALNNQVNGVLDSLQKAYLVYSGGDSSRYLQIRAETCLRIGKICKNGQKPFQAVARFEEAISFLSVLSKHDQQQYLPEMAKVYQELVEVQYQLNVDDAALIASFDSLISLYERLGGLLYQPALIECHTALAQIAYFSKPNLALFHAQQALRLSEERIEKGRFTADLLYTTTGIYSFIGLIMFHLEDEITASKYFEESLKRGDTFVSWGYSGLYSILGESARSYSTIKLAQYLKSSRKEIPYLEEAQRIAWKSMGYYEKIDTSNHAQWLLHQLTGIQHLLGLAYEKKDFKTFQDQIFRLEHLVNWNRWRELEIPSRIKLTEILSAIIKYYEETRKKTEKALFYTDLFFSIKNVSVPARNLEYLSEKIRGGSLYRRLGNLFSSKNILADALETVLQLEEADHMLWGDLLYEFGQTHTDYFNFDEAKKFLEGAVEHHKQVKQYKEIGDLDFTVSVTFQNVKKEENINREMVLPFSDIYYDYFHLSYVHTHLEDGRTAKKFLDSLEVYARFCDSSDLYDTDLLYARTYQILKDTARALTYLDQFKRKHEHPELDALGSQYAYLRIQCDPSLRPSNRKKREKVVENFLRPYEDRVFRDSISKDKTEGLLYVSLAYSHAGFLEKARILLDTAIHILQARPTPGNLTLGRATWQYAKICLQEGNLLKAREMAEMAVYVFKENLLSDRRTLDEVVEFYESLQENAEENKSHAALSEKNKKLWEQVIELEKEGDELKQKGEPENAMDLYERAAVISRTILLKQDYDLYFNSLLRILEKMTTLETGLNRTVVLLDSMVQILDVLIDRKSYDKTSPSYQKLLQQYSNTQGNLSYNLVLAKRFSEAEAASKEGLRADVKKQGTWILTNLFWAYLFQGKKELAAEIWDANKNSPYPSNDLPTFREAWQSDLQELRKRNFSHPDLEYFARLIEN